MNITDQFNKLIAPFKRRIFMMIARGVMTAIKDGEKGLQQVQMTALSDEILEKLEYVEPYGWTSVPEEGAETVALFMGGNRDHGVILSVGDRRYRLKGLKKADVAMYHKDGTKIVLRGDGRIQITNPAGNEFMKVHSDFLLWELESVVLTAFGYQYQRRVQFDDLQIIKNKHDTFKYTP